MGAVAAALLLGLLLAAGADAQARDIEVGVYVTSLSDISSEDGSFRMSLYAWFKDPAGLFDPARDLEVHARTSTVTVIETDPLPGGGTYTYLRIEAVVPQEFAFDDFPFDRQRLLLRLEAAEDVGTMRFKPDTDDTGIADDLDLLGWDIGGVALLVSERPYDSGFGWPGARHASYSVATLSLDVARMRSPVLLNSFLGFAFAFIVTGLTFFVRPSELGLRVGMTTGSLFAALLNLNRLQDAQGFRPNFGLVDRLAFLVFVAILLSLAVSLWTHRVARTDPDRADRIDTGAGAAVMLVFAVLIFLTVRASLG
jgi:hypothetical protein